MIDFWNIIGSIPVESSDDVRAALARISDRLDGLDPDGLIRFSCTAAQLHEYLYRIDRRELAESPVVFAGGVQFPQTSDQFLHTRCTCILAGVDAYEASLQSSDSFAGFVKPYALAAEELLYLAGGVYEKKVGSEMETVNQVSVESMSNVQGWEE